MAIKNIVDQMTALEVARRSSSPDAFTIIETMAQSNTMLYELPAMEANDGAVHTSLKRLSYPGGEHRMYNQGVGKKSGQTVPQRDHITMLEAFSDVDVALAQHSGNPHALYNSEASAFLIGMGLDQAGEMIYGNNDNNPAEINGLARRYPKLGDHCVSFVENPAGGEFTSAYLIAAGSNACHMIYPKGSKSVGVSREDLGVLRVQDPNDAAKMLMVHSDHFKAEYGIVVAHPDAVIRICNIPLKLTPAQRVELLELILRYQKRLTKGVVNAVLFVNEDLLYQIERAGREAQYVVHPETDPWGKPVSNINGLRIRQQDAILSAEEAVA